MTQIEQTIQYLRSRLDALKGIASDYYRGRREEIANAISFIESLEQEPDMDLDKEIDSFMESINNEATIDETAKHFYELGRSQKESLEKGPIWAGDGILERSKRLEPIGEGEIDLERIKHYFDEPKGLGPDLVPTCSELGPKIRGWVARDEDGILNFFSSECGDGEPIYDTESGTWGNATGEKIEIVHPSGAFGDLSFIDEPIEVELTITTIQNL